LHRDQGGIRVTQHDHPQGITHQKKWDPGFAEQAGTRIIVRRQRGNLFTAAFHSTDGSSGNFGQIHPATIALECRSDKPKVENRYSTTCPCSISWAKSFSARTQSSRLSWSCESLSRKSWNACWRTRVLLKPGVK